MCIHTCTCSTCGLDIKVSMCIQFCYFSFYSLDSFFYSFIPSFIHLFIHSIFFSVRWQRISWTFLSGFIPSCWPMTYWQDLSPLIFRISSGLSDASRSNHPSSSEYSHSECLIRQKRQQWISMERQNVLFYAWLYMMMMCSL